MPQEARFWHACWNNGVMLLHLQLHVYSWSPSSENWSCLHTTAALLSLHPGSAIRLQRLLWQTSTTPLVRSGPPTRRTSPLLQTIGLRFHTHEINFTSLHPEHLQSRHRIAITLFQLQLLVLNGEYWRVLLKHWPIFCSQPWHTNPRNTGPSPEPNIVYENKWLSVSYLWQVNFYTVNIIILLFSHSHYGGPADCKLHSCLHSSILMSTHSPRFHQCTPPCGLPAQYCHSLASLSPPYMSFPVLLWWT